MPNKLSIPSSGSEVLYLLLLEIVPWRPVVPAGAGADAGGWLAISMGWKAGHCHDVLLSVWRSLLFIVSQAGSEWCKSTQIQMMLHRSLPV